MREIRRVASHWEKRGPTGVIHVERFRLNPETAGMPSHLEMVFVVDSTRDCFEVTPERVEKEWLFSVPATREARLFERSQTRSAWVRDFARLRMAERTCPNALVSLQPLVAQLEGPVAQRITQWVPPIGYCVGTTGCDNASLYCPQFG